MKKSNCVPRVNIHSANYTTYNRKIFCDECGKLVTQQGVIELQEDGNGPDRWTATYYCEQRQYCPKHIDCEYTKTRHDAKPPIMDKYEFKARIKKLDAQEGFISDD